MQNTLKSNGDPFTDSEEVKPFPADPTLSENAKQQRMKLKG